MAITKPMASRCGGTASSAYILADLSLDNKTKSGRLELAIWKDAAARAAGAKKINNIAIAIHNAAQDDADMGHVRTLSWSDFAWRTGAEVYSKIKTLSIFDPAAQSVVSLSDATDC